MMLRLLINQTRLISCSKISYLKPCSSIVQAKSKIKPESNLSLSSSDVCDHDVLLDLNKADEIETLERLDDGPSYSKSLPVKTKSHYDELNFNGYF